MKPITHIQRINPLLERPLFHAKEARTLGCTTALLAYYVKKGIIERIDRGVYRGTNSKIDVDFMHEDLILAAKAVPDGVICLVSALEIYGYTEEIPRAHWIAVSHERIAPRRKKVKIVRMRNMTLGRVHINIGSETVSIFDRERTIIDAFRYLGKETAIKALKAAIADRNNKVDMVKLRRYAKTLRVPIDTILMVLSV